MTLVTNILIIAVIIFAGYLGSRRGLVLLALELLGFIIATIAAFALYHPLGSVLSGPLQVSDSLGNISAFVIIWIAVEIICALIVRFAILSRIDRSVHLSTPNRMGGAVAGSLKSTALIILALIIFAGVPLPQPVKSAVYESAIPRALLAAAAPVQSLYNASLGHDIVGSLDFFTIPSEPESDTRIDLGYTTTNVKVDATAEASMLELVNQERTSRGLKSLSANDKARAVARAYSSEMFARGYFSHVTPEGKTPFDRMKAGGVRYSSAGENLALAPTLKQAHDGLMKSPGHKANILSPEYRTVGIGIVVSPIYGMMVTQNFTD